LSSKQSEPQGLSEHIDAVLRLAGEMAATRYALAMVGKKPRKIEPYGVLAPYVRDVSSEQQEQPEVTDAIRSRNGGIQSFPNA
jgi:hypothetical protein